MLPQFLPGFAFSLGAVNDVVARVEGAHIFAGFRRLSGVRA